MSDTKSTIFSRTLIREKVKILPTEVGSNIREVVMAKLRIMLDGHCSRHGYVRPGSIKMMDLSDGKLEGASLNGDTIYRVSIVADVCNPAQGHIVPARIVASNKFGLLAHSGIEIAGKYTTILKIVITRHNYSGGPVDVPVDSVRIGDDVFVEILGKTFELGDVEIQGSGRLLRAVGTANRRPLMSTAVINPDMNASDSEREDDAFSVDMDNEEEEEEEKEEEEEEEEDEDEEREDVEEEEEDAVEEEEDDVDLSGELDDDFDLTADDDDFPDIGIDSK